MTDQGSLYPFIPQKVSPPEGLWQRISSSLEEEKNKQAFIDLNNWEEKPPTAVWEKIREGLEAQSNNKEAQLSNILDVGVKPPPALWQNIQTQLDNQSVKTLPQNKKQIYKIGIALAIAASIVGIIIFIQPLKNSENSSALVKTETQVPNKTTINIKANDTVQNQNLPNSDANTAKISKNSKLDLLPIVTIGHADNVYADESQYLTDSETAINMFKPFNSIINEPLKNVEKFKDLSGNIINNIDDYQTYAINYKSALGPNGDNVRVSQKLSNMIEFIDDNDTVLNAAGTDVSKVEHIDSVIRQSGYYKMRFASWKVVLSADMHNASINFADPFELLRYCQHKK